MNKNLFYGFIIVLFHLVGLFGFLNPAWEVFFIKLVPYHLLLMLLIMIFTVEDRSYNLLKFALLVYLAGYLIEVLGVNTGLIFGNYRYGSALGLKVWEVPLLIGVNWLILVYCTGIFLQSVHVKNGSFLQLEH